MTFPTLAEVIRTKPRRYIADATGLSISAVQRMADGLHDRRHHSGYGGGAE